MTSLTPSTAIREVIREPSRDLLAARDTRHTPSISGVYTATLHVQKFNETCGDEGGRAITRLQVLDGGLQGVQMETMTLVVR